MPNESGNAEILPGLQVVYDGEPGSAAMNMALDEALLRMASQPILRFYGWRRPSLSFGYFGRFSDVAEEESQRELVRRWTGGGIVFHGNDLTYSIILPRRHVVELPAPQTVYRQVHGAIRAALAEHLEVALAHENAPKTSDVCFANAVTADVLVRGRKIAGAAQRRTRQGLLHQGSIQHEDLPASFATAFAAGLCSQFETVPLAPAVIASAEQLAAEKYATSEWLRQR